LTVAITEEADRGLTSYLLVVRSCIIDGEAVACDGNRVTPPNSVRYRHQDESLFLYAFHLIELNGRSPTGPPMGLALVPLVIALVLLLEWLLR
jgi:ATP-dependent DNA ligase